MKEKKEKVVIEVMPKNFSEREIEKALLYKRMREAIINNDKKEIDKIIEEQIADILERDLKELGLKKSIKNKTLGNKETM